MRFYIVISSANFKKSAIGSEPVDRTKIKGVIIEESLQHLANSNVGTTMYYPPMISVIYVWIAGINCYLENDENYVTKLIIKNMFIICSYLIRTNSFQDNHFLKRIKALIPRFRKFHTLRSSGVKDNSIKFSIFKEMFINSNKFLKLSHSIELSIHIRPCILIYPISGVLSNLNIT